MLNQQVQKVLDSIEEVKSIIKSIGTSSSIDQDRDERSIDASSRGDYNTNQNSQQGGNTMNTTEPDASGTIAVEKTINSVTNPEGNISTSDAPTGPVPTNEIFQGEGSAIAPSKSDEMAQPQKFAKGETCPTCGTISKGDDIEDADQVEKAAEPDEDDAKVTKSIWGGAFGLVSPKNTQ